MDGDCALVLFDDLFGDGQAEAGAGLLAGRVEGFEDDVRIGDAAAVVTAGDEHAAVRFVKLRGHFDSALPGFHRFDGIEDEV